jgi:hypothetical protein
MAQLDPTKIKVQSNALPVWETEVTFQEMMADRLRQAPWLILSAGLHAVLLLLAWVLFPAEEKKKIENKVEMTQQDIQEVVEPPPPPPPETKPEEVTEEVVVTETQATETPTENAFDNVESESTAKESAFDSNQWNSAVGLGGGAGGRYGGRGGGGKGGKGGKSYATNIDAGLQWLKNHQDEDGKWDCDQFSKHDDPALEVCDGPGNATHDVGVTGLALLAFLGDGSTMRSGTYKEVVKKGVNWLRSQQDEKTGMFGMPTAHDFIYDHAIAAYAMCEAFGLSQYNTLKPYAQKGINYLEKHRNPYSVWRYQEADGENDTSVTGWAIMAYESGEFFGLTINKEALKLCATWLDSVSDPSGRHGYSKVGEPSSRKGAEHLARFPVEKGEGMTAVGLFCRFFMSQDPKEKPIMKAAADLILSKPPVWDTKAGTIDHYYWYYATYALFQMGGRHWTEWQKKLESAVVKNQQLSKEPGKKNLYGSWDPTCAWGEDGGRVYSTAILTLTLEAYYRYSRLVR